MKGSVLRLGTPAFLGLGITCLFSETPRAATTCQTIAQQSLAGAEAEIIADAPANAIASSVSVTYFYRSRRSGAAWMTCPDSNGCEIRGNRPLETDPGDGAR